MNPANQVFAREKWLMTILLLVGHVFEGLCVGLQGPVYPHEADKRGLKASEYTMVVGILQLVIFFVSPIIGNNLFRFGVKRTLCICFAINGVDTILFGTLEYVDDARLFLAFSFILRIINGCAVAGVFPATFSFAVLLYPHDTMIFLGLIETAYSIGVILGPFIGGLLYRVGGFILPFAAVGTGFVWLCLCSACLLPQIQKDTNNNSRATMVKALKIPGVWIALLSVFITATSIGLLQGVLEPYLRHQFEMGIVETSLVFMANSIAYGVAAPITGRVCDKYSPYVSSCVGILLMIISFGLVGPLPFLGIPQHQALTISALVVMGSAYGIQTVSGYAILHEQVIANGIPEKIETYGVEAGIINSSFALGAFIGPTVAGYLTETVGFHWTALMIICPEIAILTLLIIFIVFINRKYQNGFQPSLQGECNEADMLIQRD